MSAKTFILAKSKRTPLRDVLVFLLDWMKTTTDVFFA